MYNTSDLNRIISLETPISTRNEFGEEIKTYKFFKKVWSNVIPISSNKRFLNNEKKSIEINRFIVRYNKSINESLIIKYRDRSYNITGIIKDSQNDFLELLGESIE